MLQNMKEELKSNSSLQFDNFHKDVLFKKRLVNNKKLLRKEMEPPVRFELTT